MKREYVALFSAISTSERLADLPDDAARLFFTWLLPQCDAHGRIGASARKLNAVVWPLLGKTVKDTEKALSACVSRGLLDIHKSGSVEWIQVPDWSEKAGKLVRTGRIGPSEFPDPSDNSRSTPGSVQESSGVLRSEERRERVEEKRADQKAASPPAARSARAVSAPRAPSGNVQVMIDLWQKAWRMAEGTDYELHPGDAPAVAAFVKRTGARFSAKAVWQHAATLLATSDAFWLTNRNLRTLATRWSDVEGIPRAEAERNSRAWKSDYDRGLEAIMAAQREDEARTRAAQLEREDESRAPALPPATGTHLQETSSDAIHGRTRPLFDGSLSAQRRLPAVALVEGHDSARPRAAEDLPRGRDDSSGQGPRRVGQGIGGILGEISSGGDHRGAETRL